MRTIVHTVVGLLISAAVLVADEPAAAPASPDAAAAAPVKKLRKKPLVRPRLKSSDAIVGITEPERPQSADTVLGGGTVPALWEIPQPSHTEADELAPLSERASIAPAVPGKVLRYAVWIMQQYDTDGDGSLKKEEWAKMPGAPQAMDLDGDGIITLDELVRFLSVYGEKRTIHRPYPVDTFYQPRIVSSQFQLFKPLSAPPTPPSTTETKPKTEEPQTDETATSEDVVDDATYEEIVAGKLAPAEKKYHTEKEKLRGVPTWFLIRDRDGDGQVSLLEFAPSLTPQALAMFGKLDLNGDGFITPDEVRKPDPPAPPPAEAAPPPETPSTPEATPATPPTPETPTTAETPPAPVETPAPSP